MSEVPPIRENFRYIIEVSGTWLRRVAAFVNRWEGVYGDEVLVSSGSGEPGDPGDHHETHEDGGDDEISVAGLSGVLADKQDADKIQGRTVSPEAPSDGDVLQWNATAAQYEPEPMGEAGVALHADTHAGGGADPLKLDDLAEPDDNTDLNASTAKHGLMPKLDGSTSHYLRGDGSWQHPPSDLTGTGDAGKIAVWSASTVLTGATLLSLIKALFVSDPSAYYPQVLRIDSAGGDPYFDDIFKGDEGMHHRNLAMISNELGKVEIDDTGIGVDDISAIPPGTEVGDMAYWNGSAWVRIPQGAAGQILIANGAASPYWYNPVETLPPGGSARQVLQKASGDSYDVAWDWVRSV